MNLSPAIPIVVLLFHVLHGVLPGEIVFHADFNDSSPVTGTVTDNASPANLNAGTQIGTWTLGGAGGGNPGAILGNATLADNSFVFDSAISGNANDLAIGSLTRAIQLSNGEGLVLDFKLYASRQGTGRQVHLLLQNETGVPAYGIAFALDNSKSFGWLDTADAIAVLATTASANTGFTNPAVNNYLSWTSGTMISASIEIRGHTTLAGSAGAALSVDWNGDGDFTDEGETSQTEFGPTTAGISSISRFQLGYGGNTGNRGIYLDDVIATSVPLDSSSAYVWTGTASGGDGVSLYQEANWTLNGDNTSIIPQINPDTAVNRNLVINAGNPGGAGATGTLSLGAGVLTVSGGTLRLNSSSGIVGGSIQQEGGNAEALYIESTTVTIAHGNIKLHDSGDALRAGAMVDFSTTSTGALIR